MHAKYAERGLRILAFPSNQFGNQVSKIKLSMNLATVFASLGVWITPTFNVLDRFLLVGAGH